jgi:putative ABC transport system permease protein
VLTESLVLAVGGGALGIALAWAGVRIAGNADVVHAAGAYDVSLSLPVLAFAAAISILAGILFGLAPAFDAGRQSMRAGIGDAARVVSGRSGLRAALVVAEVSLTVVLLVGAGLLVRSFANLLVVDKGFDADQVVSFSVSLPDAKYPTAIVKTQTLKQITERLAALPGVAGVGLVNELPLGGGGVNGTVPIQGQTYAPGQAPAPEKRIVSPDYFRVMGIRLKSGRVFTEHDTASSPAVMVVSESFARRYFNGASPLGAHAGFNWDMEGTQEIVGVVADVRHYGLDEDPSQMVYVSYLQRPLDSGGIVVKATGDTTGLMTKVRQTMQEIDKDRPLRGLDNMSTLVSASVATRRFVLILASAFAALGVLLAVTGVYGVVSYGSRQRVALGATSSNVLRLVLKQGLVPVGVGLALGIGGAFALSGLIRNQLFGVQPSDPMTFVTVAAGLGLVALVACYVPARRAVGVDAARVLRRD